MKLQFLFITSSELGIFKFTLSINKINIFGLTLPTSHRDGDSSIYETACSDRIAPIRVEVDSPEALLSVQKKIYLSVGGKTDGEYYKEAWEKFSDRVG